jgi:hypothetical protein
MVGRQIIAQIKRTKKDEGTNKRAVFDFYSMETDQYPFGVDKETDVIRTAKRLGIFTGSGWLYHSTFPEGKLHGEPAVIEWLKNEASDEVREQIRTEVLDRIKGISNESTTS